jgi:hypothetical protein
VPEEHEQQEESWHPDPAWKCQHLQTSSHAIRGLVGLDGLELPGRTRARAIGELAGGLAEGLSADFSLTGYAADISSDPSATALHRLSSSCLSQ